MADDLTIPPFVLNPMGTVRLYHPSGALVTLPVTVPAPDYHELLDCVGKALEAGWLVTAPGLEEGEQRFEAAAVCLRTKTNDDHSETPVVDLYERDFEWKSLSVYLNDDAAERAFEAASGLSLSKLTPFPAQAAPQRGASKQTDRFIVEVPRPFMVICKANPKYDPNETDAKKKKPKRVFVRWADGGAKPPAEHITPEQVTEIRHLIAERRALGQAVNEAAFLNWLGVGAIEEIPRAKYEQAVGEMRRKLQTGGGGR